MTRFSTPLNLRLNAKSPPLTTQRRAVFSHRGPGAPRVR